MVACNGWIYEQHLELRLNTAYYGIRIMVNDWVGIIRSVVLYYNLPKHFDEISIISYIITQLYLGCTAANKTTATKWLTSLNMDLLEIIGCRGDSLTYSIALP